MNRRTERHAGIVLAFARPWSAATGICIIRRAPTFEDNAMTKAQDQKKETKKKPLKTKDEKRALKREKKAGR
ncbi:MAG: hypothetical protein ABIT36_10955 [Steroidobacteraceae bacterium]